MLRNLVEKIFTPAFLKSDQCERNCSWISGETSAAFSFVVGTILLKNHYFLILNFILGFLVFFCRMAMGGHFFSDNIFAMIFMIYLAILYKRLIYLFLKKKNFMKRILIITDEKKSSLNQCMALTGYLEKNQKVKIEYLTIKKNYTFFTKFLNSNFSKFK